MQASPTLKRALGRWDLAAIGINQTIGGASTALLTSTMADAMCTSSTQEYSGSSKMVHLGGARRCVRVLRFETNRRQEGGADARRRGG